MKRLVALLLVALLGYMVYNGLYTDENLLITSENRAEVSEGYIHKNVTSKSDDLVVFEQSNDLEDGSANMVTSIVVGYRSFDTLGEVTVLFLTSIGVSLLLFGFDEKYKFKIKNSHILETGGKIVVPIILLLGVFMFTHGHLTPGGGFPGGSMIGGAVLLLYLSNESFRIKVMQFKIAESLSGIIYVSLGIAGLFVANYFLENLIGTGTVGTLLSGGLIPIVYVLVGLKVGSEVSGIINHFISEEVRS